MTISLLAQFTRPVLEAAGFEGFMSIGELWDGKIGEVPTYAGAYVVLREADTQPIFLNPSPAGWFKGKDPTANPDELASRWISRVPVIYIGKAGGHGGLQRRIKRYIDFGAGKPVGHWGGRFIWQVEGSAGFVIAWKLTSVGETAAELERCLLQEFKRIHKSLPFANLVAPWEKP